MQNSATFKDTGKFFFAAYDLSIIIITTKSNRIVVMVKYLIILILLSSCGDPQAIIKKLGSQEVLLEIELQPLVTQTSQVISPPIKVVAKDLSGNTVSDYSGSLTLTLNTHNALTAGNISGTLTQSFSNGEAIFDDIVVDTAAEGVQFNFSDGSIDVNTINFEINDAITLYRSIGGAGAEISTSGATGFTVSISSGVMTFSGSLPANVGVGDAVEIDLDDSNTLTGAGDALYFIHGRISNSEFIVRNSLGAVPPDLAANDTWELDRAYLSLNDAETFTDNPRIITASTYTASNIGSAGGDNSVHFAFYADAIETANVTVNGFTMGASDGPNYVRFFTPYLQSEVGISQRHAGFWDDTKFKIATAPNAARAIRYLIYKMRIEGIQFDWDTNTTADRAVIQADFITTGTDLRISNCIFRDSGGSAGQHAMNLDSRTVNPNQIFHIYNNVIYGFDRAGIVIGEGAGGTGEGQYYIYNNTFDDMDKAVEIVSKDTGTHIVRNNIAQNIVTAGFDGVFDAPSDYNISNLGDGPGANSINSSTVQFVSAGNYLLSASDTVATNTGEDLRQDTNIPFDFSITGELRGDLWSIGADQ